jgi:hypothetical protein
MASISAGKSSKGPINQPGLQITEQHSKITSQNGIVIEQYLAKHNDTTPQYSDHAPIVYDLYPLNPFIRIITWNVANFGNGEFSNQAGNKTYNHKFPIKRLETDAEYSNRIDQIATAIADMYKDYKPLAEGIEPIIMCQELPFDHSQPNFKIKLNTELKNSQLKLLIDSSENKECNIICGANTTDIGVINFSDQEINDEKAKKQLNDNIHKKTSYFYKIYFKTYLVIFVNVHLQFNVNCDDYINGILGMILRWLNTPNNGITGKYESLLSIIFVGDFNRSLLYQDFANVNATLAKFNTASMHLYTTTNDESYAYADNAGTKNTNNVDYMMEVKFTQPFNKVNIP